MRVRFYVLEEDDDRELGALILKDGRVQAEPMTAHDRLALDRLAAEPIFVELDGRPREIHPDQEPKLFLEQLHRHYHGAYLRAGSVER